MVDKDTEYLANFNTKSRHNPVDLLRAYVNTTGKRPRYLRVAGAKEFVSDDMVAYCVQNHRSGPGVARTILLFHIISARPSKQPLRVRTVLKVYMELGS